MRSTASGLRIGLVCPYSFDTPGGVQNHVLGLANYLREQGHHPHILAPGDQVSPGFADPGNDSAPARFTSAGSAVAVRYNGSVARVNFGPVSAARVGRWLRRGQFDLVHIHEPITPSISMLALWAAEVPVVATFHTATPRSRSMQLARGALRPAIEKIDAGIAVSESARKVVVQHLGRDAVVIPNGFSYAEFAGPCSTGGLAASSSGRRDTKRSGQSVTSIDDGRLGGPKAVGASRWRGGEGPRLSFLGRMDEPRKGLDTLLAALPQIRFRFPNLDVVIAGEGKRALPDGCRAVGIVSDAQKAELLAGSDVFVAPHVARESFGIVLLEAMASRTPVVASALPAFADLLAGEPGSACPSLGSVFAVGEADQLAAAVSHVLTHRDLERIDAAQQASRRYDWSVVGAAVTEVYRATQHLVSGAVSDSLVAR